MQNAGGPENRCYMTETRAFGFSVLLGSIICNRETVGKKTCAIKKAAAFAFEAVNDSMVRRCSNERRAYKGRGSFGGWNHGVFRLAYQKLGRSKDKDNRYCFADAVLLTLRLDVPPRRRGIAHSTSQPCPYQAKTLTLEAASIKINQPLFYKQQKENSHFAYTK